MVFVSCSVRDHRILSRAIILLLVLVLAFELAACASASTSTTASACSSIRGGMSCRALSETAADDAAATISHMGSNITVPAEIMTPSESRLLVVLRAVGHQHYRYNSSAWVLYNASAWLYEEEEGAETIISREAVVGTHFYLAQPDSSGGQPTWQLGTSKVTARSVASTTVDAASITWNLLEATSHQMIISGDSAAASSASNNWSWVVGDVKFVQRLDTQRGLPPNSPSTTAALGDTYSSVYAALYAFYA